MERVSDNNKIGFSNDKNFIITSLIAFKVSET